MTEKAQPTLGLLAFGEDIFHDSTLYEEGIASANPEHRYPNGPAETGSDPC
jgi:hypothetical protein